MSTLRVSNIEAKADASSPSVNEKVKVTNSQGDVLIHIDGSTSGITTVGINTTGSSFDIDANQNVTFAGVVTATSFVGNLTGDVTVATGATISASTNTIIASTNGSERLRISSNGAVCVGSGYQSSGGGQLTIRGLGVNSYAVQDYQYVGTPSSGTTLSQIRFTANTSGASVIAGARIQAAADDDWSATGDAPTRLLFYTTPNGSSSQVERLRITSDGEVKMPSQPMMQVYAITTASKSVSGGSATTLIPLNAANTYDPGNDIDLTTGVYTIPVTGRYLTFYGTEGKTAANVNAGSIYYNINNAGINGQCLYYGEAYSGNSKQVIISLAAGDTIKWQLYGNNNNAYTINSAVYGIYLLG